MDSEYHCLIGDLKHILRVFRIKLLLFHLLRGGVIIGGTILLSLFFYFLCGSLFQFTVLSKTIFYYSFFFSLFFEVLVFIGYPLICFFLYTFYENDRLLKVAIKYIPFHSDVFVFLYHIAFHGDHMKGDEQLKRAAFVQKYNFLRSNHLLPVFSNRFLFKQLFLFVILFILFIFNFHNFALIYSDLIDYNIVKSKYALSFQVQNETLEVETGKDIRLKLKVENDDYVVEQVFICYGGGEFLMTKEDSIFIYDFEVVNNDIQLYFKALNQESRIYKIKVLPTPLITEYKVVCVPPVYTNLKAEVLQNTVDFRVLYGSHLKFDFKVMNTDTLCLENESQLSEIPLDHNTASLNLNIHHSGVFNICGSNSDFKIKNLLSFNVICIPDLYPVIQISEIQDSLRNSVHYFYGVITDDYGFSALRFNYSLDNQSTTVIPIPFSKQLNSQEFYFSFDFAEFAGLDKSIVHYYFEVFDNDDISGPKSTRSAQQNYHVPDLNTVFDSNLEMNHVVNISLGQAEKLTSEIVSGIKELQKKMLGGNMDNWEQQQLVKDILQKKEKLDQFLHTVRENNLKKLDLNKSFTNQDSVLIEKQKQIQDLLDNIMDDEMKNLMKEFSKLSDEFSKEQFKNLDDKMRLSFDQMTDELDRNIELLKRFQIEERHDLISKQLDQLIKDQEKLSNATEKNDSLSIWSQHIKESIKYINKNYHDLIKDNSDLSEPYFLNQFESSFENLNQKIGRQDELMSKDKIDKQLSENIIKELEDFSDEIKKQQEQNFVNNLLPQNDIELIIQNILIISLSEEKLLKQFHKVESQSLAYTELGKLQDLKRQEYKIVKDSLSILAKSNLMLASLLNHKFYDIETKFGLLSGYIQDNKKSELIKEQQYIINYLNDIALALTDFLQKSKQAENDFDDNGENGSKPDHNGKKSSSGKSGYGVMKKFQNNLKEQLKNLVEKMENGEKGKPLQHGISNMIRENELFRKSLNDFISESGSLSNIEKQLLNEVNKLLDENIRDLANYSVSSQIINRNNLIYNKLVMSERASQEHEEFEEKRKSESASDAHFKRPDIQLNIRKKSSLIKSDFQKSDLKLTNYFKVMYNNYYIKLGDE